MPSAALPMHCARACLTSSRPMAAPTDGDALTAIPPAIVSTSTPPAPAEPSLAELRREVDERRREYRAVLTGKTNWSAMSRWNADDGTTSQLIALNDVAESFLKIQRAKLAYEEAYERLRAAEDGFARRASDATQRSVARATWTVVLVSAVSVLVALLSMFKH